VRTAVLEHVEMTPVPSWPAAPLRPLTQQEFVLFQALIYRETGIFLSATKKALLVGRLSKRLRELGLSSFGAYYRVIGKGGDPFERVRMLDCICTNETHFFREPRQFDFLTSQVFPEWTAQANAGTRSRSIRVWSAGCSTGEEPYSLAMILLAHFPASAGWSIDVLGTDLSTRALDNAQAALWPIEKSREIPPSYLKAYMLKGRGHHEGQMKAGPEIRSVVRFERLNLYDGCPTGGPFDFIFCRNVLIYFNAESRSRVIHRLMEHLPRTGYLFLGHAESLNGVTDRLRSVGPTVYGSTERRLSQRNTQGPSMLGRRSS
jgi:chemotaxis protein methyltransferase CheR